MLEKCKLEFSSAERLLVASILAIGCAARPVPVSIAQAHDGNVWVQVRLEGRLPEQNRDPHAGVVLHGSRYRNEVVIHAQRTPYHLDRRITDIPAAELCTTDISGLTCYHLDNGQVQVCAQLAQSDTFDIWDPHSGRWTFNEAGSGCVNIPPAQTVFTCTDKVLQPLFASHQKPHFTICMTGRLLDQRP